VARRVRAEARHRPACRKTSACARSSAASSSIRACSISRTAAATKVYLASADWMDRNFFRESSCCFPVLDPALKRRVIREGLQPYLDDNCQGLGDGGRRQLRAAQAAPPPPLGAGRAALYPRHARPDAAVDSQRRAQFACRRRGSGAQRGLVPGRAGGVASCFCRWASGLEAGRRTRAACLQRAHRALRELVNTALERPWTASRWKCTRWPSAPRTSAARR